MPLSKRLAAQLVGTFWLVFGGCGSVVLVGTFPETGIGFLGVAFGFSVLTMAYTVGHISGTRLNPAALGTSSSRPFADRRSLAPSR